VNRVCSGTSDDVDELPKLRPTLPKAIVHHLKFLHDFGRKLGCDSTCVLVVVVQAIDGEIVLRDLRPPKVKPLPASWCRTARPEAIGELETPGASRTKSK